MPQSSEIELWRLKSVEGRGHRGCCRRVCNGVRLLYIYVKLSSSTCCEFTIRLVETAMDKTIGNCQKNWNLPVTVVPGPLNWVYCRQQKQIRIHHSVQSTQCWFSAMLCCVIHLLFLDPGLLRGLCSWTVVITPGRSNAFFEQLHRLLREEKGVNNIPQPLVSGVSAASSGNIKLSRIMLKSVLNRKTISLGFFFFCLFVCLFFFKYILELFIRS